MANYLELQDFSELDELNDLDEKIAEATIELALMEDEEPQLKILVEAAERVRLESKIRTILDLLDRQFPDQSVLFFTEYKATQSLLISALMKKYGDNCVTFINGDGEAREIIDSAGHNRTLRLQREEASARFNEGKVRFLVSTEAAGEGIDLQQNCHCLIHVDLPWNPMRMHQRVGRLNRYGQTNAVEVVSVRNPDTVESRVWDKLTEKLTNITKALSNVMAEPEDLQQLVLGMTSPMFFNDLFTQGADIAPEQFSDWFDRSTSRFGDSDVLDTVRELLGNSARFDFQQVSDRLPKVDLPDLKPFFVSMVTMNGRRTQDSGEGLSFLTPEEWFNTPRILREYRNVKFVRSPHSSNNTDVIAGVGHILMIEALKQARACTACVTTLPHELWPFPLYVFQIVDRVTTTGGTVRSVLAGVQIGADEKLTLVRDWEILLRMNAVLEQRSLRRDEAPAQSPGMAEEVKKHSAQASEFLLGILNALDLPFVRPEVAWLATILSGEK